MNTVTNLPWDDIDCVLLDMDGTLLDLHFDTHFWSEHVPLRFAEKQGLSLAAAKAALYPRFHALTGTMDWYCLDYWSRELDLDIAALKREVEHLIAVLPRVREFLHGVRQSGRRVVLVTNAHMQSLALKMERTGLESHFDALVCSHHYRLPKEQPEFWQRMQQQESFDPRHTLLVDDSLPVLRSARTHGIANLRAVARPDTCQPQRDTGEFDAIGDFGEIMPDGAFAASDAPFAQAARTGITRATVA